MPPDRYAHRARRERFQAIASYKDSNGALCREFELDGADKSTVVAVAYRPDAVWEIQFTVVAGSSDTGYAPASSLDSLNAYLSAVGAGQPLSSEDEKTALKALR